MFKIYHGFHPSTVALFVIAGICIGGGAMYSHEQSHGYYNTMTIVAPVQRPFSGDYIDNLPSLSGSLDEYISPDRTMPDRCNAPSNFRLHVMIDPPSTKSAMHTTHRLVAKKGDKLHPTHQHLAAR